MKNTTVKELIEILEKMNPDAVVCHYDLSEDELHQWEVMQDTFYSIADDYGINLDLLIQ